MPRGKREFKMTATRSLVAYEVARDRLLNDEIISKYGITMNTLYHWKEQPLFQKEVEMHRRAWRDEVLKMGVAQQSSRIANLNEVVTGLRTIVKERANAPEMQDVPGGKTGLLSREAKIIVVNEGGELDEDGTVTPTRQKQIVYDYTVDAGLVKELRETQKMVAQEIGEWVDKKKTDIGFDLSGLSDEELELLERILRKSAPNP